MEIRLICDDSDYDPNSSISTNDILIRIRIKFLIKILDSFDIFLPERCYWAFIESYLVNKINNFLTIEEFNQLTSYRDYLSLLLTKLTVEPELYNTSVSYFAFENFRYGFTYEESLKLYETLNEFIEELSNKNELPHGFDATQLFNSCTVSLYDYIICYLDNEDERIIHHIVNGKLNHNCRQHANNIRIYQIV